MKTIIINALNLYQKIFSPNHSPLSRLSGFKRCRFYPTCSEYTKQAIERYGILRGITLAFGRLIRCQALFGKNGGYDPLK